MRKIQPHNSQTGVDLKLAKLRRAMIAVEKLLFGELANSRCRVAIEPDWNNLKPQLLSLNEDYGFDCLELSEILTCKPKFLPALKPENEAVRWLLSKDLPDVLQNPAGYMEIQRANESQDLDFFKALGETIKGWHKRRSSSVHGNLSEVRLTLMKWWKPSGNWPGLAYFTLKTRCDFLTILEKQKALIYPFESKITPNNLDGIRRALGLKPARSPFISHITLVGSSVQFS